ncbi:hypothetical protein quinque_000629 [Culex quinquefasciatus]
MTLSLRLVVLGALWLAYCGGASKLAAKAGLDDEAAVAAAAFKEDTLASNMLPEQEPPHVTKGPAKPAKPTKPPAAKNAPTAAKGPRNEYKFQVPLGTNLDSLKIDRGTTSIALYADNKLYSVGAVALLMPD